jgi:predicted permease
MTIALNILPIFPVIGIGLGAKRTGFLPREFLGPGNRLAFFIAIPAMLFRAIALTPLRDSISLTAVGICLGSLVLGWSTAMALGARLFSGHRGSSRASWIQTATHGNQGILGLAVVIYGLGPDATGSAGLLTAVLIVGQNILSIYTLNRWGVGRRQKGSLIKQTMGNPIILSTLAGLLFALTPFTLPMFVDRTLQIVGDMGLPLALMMIGAVLADTRLGQIDLHSMELLAAIKLLVLPAVGLGLLLLTQVTGLSAAIVLVLLSSPSATLCVVLANEMGGDARLASTAISVTHAFSILTYPLWLYIGTRLF